MAKTLAIFAFTVCKPNYGKSGAGFCHQVAAWVPEMFCNFYLLKNHTNVNSSAIVKAREKNKHIFKI